MRRNKAKKENPPARLLGTMILLVLGLVVAYATLALGILFLVRRLVHLEDKSYTLLWPILILSVSALLGILLAIFIFRGYLAPLSADEGHKGGGGRGLLRTRGAAGCPGRGGGVHPQLQQNGGGAGQRGAAAVGLREHLFP